MKILIMARTIIFLSITLYSYSPYLYAEEIPIVVDHRVVDADTIPQKWLDKARSLKVFFGHQSVGENILMWTERHGTKITSEVSG